MHRIITNMAFNIFYHIFAIYTYFSGYQLLKEKSFEFFFGKLNLYTNLSMFVIVTINAIIFIITTLIIVKKAKISFKAIAVISIISVGINTIIFYLSTQELNQIMLRSLFLDR